MNWKDPVFKAIDYNGEWHDDEHNISRFYDYSCEMPSGAVIERSARFFSFLSFVKAIARWNKSGNGRGYKYYYTTPNEYTDPNIHLVGMIVNGEVKELVL